MVSPKEEETWRKKGNSWTASFWNSKSRLKPPKSDPKAKIITSGVISKKTEYIRVVLWSAWTDHHREHPVAKVVPFGLRLRLDGNRLRLGWKWGSGWMPFYTSFGIRIRWFKAQTSTSFRDGRNGMVCFPRFRGMQHEKVKTRRKRTKILKNLMKFSIPLLLALIIIINPLINVINIV